ncbi:MAG: DNA-binding response regulator [Rhodobacteraceae bacterium]|nr:DNA-binding response regulator [Paracoccaceae bacterium]
MTDPQPQSALRELRNHITAPTTLAGLAGVALILAIVGPFGTNEYLRPGPRLVFWLAQAFGTYSVAQITARLVWRALPAALPRPVLLGLVAVANGLAVSAVVAAINYTSFEYWMSPSEAPAFLAKVFGIAAIITVLIEIFGRTQRAAAAGTAQSPRPAVILSRMPLEKRGPLVALSVEDHYVRVRTTKGEEMILMRLADAIAETGDTAGLQVHRSHWVALDQVRGVRREGDRAILSMAHGPDIPASRSNIAALKEAGLLPG